MINLIQHNVTQSTKMKANRKQTRVRASSYEPGQPGWSRFPRSRLATLSFVKVGEAGKNRDLGNRVGNLSHMNTLVRLLRLDIFNWTFFHLGNRDEIYYMNMRQNPSRLPGS